MNALQAYRKAQGLTLAAAADRIGGVSVGSLSRIENGEQWPSADLARRIAAVTDGQVTPNDLLALTAGAERAVVASSTCASIELDGDLAARARAEGIDLQAEFAVMIKSRLAAIDADRWRRENADAIRHNNEELRLNGLWSDGYRLF